MAGLLGILAIATTGFAYLLLPVMPERSETLAIMGAILLVGLAVTGAVNDLKDAVEKREARGRLAGRDQGPPLP